MEIIKVIPRGFCKGVVMAINIAKQTKQKYPNKNVYILGMLVHNKYVIDALNEYGIISIESKYKTRMELLDEIEEGVVIFTAHGVHEKIKQKAMEKGLICVDASCQYVLNTQKIVNEYVSDEYEVLYIGKKNHPEASAVCDYNKHIHLIENTSDLEDLNHYNKVFVTNQTTMSAQDVHNLFQTIKQKYPHAIIADEICSATSTRQQAIRNLKNVDALIVVGDKSSNNANRLAQIAKDTGIKHVELIDDVNDLDIKTLLTLNRIAVSAGASTPTYLINQVIQTLSTQDTKKQKIDLTKII